MYLSCITTAHYMPVQGAWDCGASCFNFLYGTRPLETAR